jgi:hypothetical protein
MISAILLLGSAMAAGGSAPASAHCLFGTSVRWPSKTVNVNGDLTWNPTTRGYVNTAVRTWNAVTPSPLAYSNATWLSSVPSQATGLVLTRGRFSGDHAAPGIASGALGTKHARVAVIYSSNTSRWSWSNTAHGPMKSSGTVSVDIRTVTVHEVGHAAGLAHPWECGGTFTGIEEASVMTAQWDGPRRALNSDDRAGLNAMGY